MYLTSNSFMENGAESTEQKNVTGTKGEATGRRRQRTTSGAGGRVIAAPSPASAVLAMAEITDHTAENKTLKTAEAASRSLQKDQQTTTDAALVSTAHQDTTKVKTQTR